MVQSITYIEFVSLNLCRQFDHKACPPAFHQIHNVLPVHVRNCAMNDVIDSLGCCIYLCIELVAGQNVAWLSQVKLYILASAR